MAHYFIGNFFPIFLAFLSCLHDERPIFAVGQDSNTTSDRPVNLFIINEEQNVVANKSVTNSIKVMKEKFPDWVGKVFTIELNDTDAQASMDRLCSAWDSALQEPASEVPDMVLDITRSGLGTDAVTFFTASLGIPTLSGKFGQFGDLRFWRQLTPEQSMYLVQIMPPADIIPEVIRDMAAQLNISNLAIIYDEDFVMDHKYKNLLLNVPTRHMITNAEKTKESTLRQLERLRTLDIVNFFILGGVDTLTMILDAAQMLNYTGRQYSWIVLAQEELEPKCECKNFPVLMFQPVISPNVQQSLSDLINQGLLPRPVLASSFYYDLARMAVGAMKLAMKENAWPKEPTQSPCSAVANGTGLTRNFDFLSTLKRVRTDMGISPSFADISWGTSNGYHHATFNMSVSELIFDQGRTISNSQIGIWKASMNASAKESIIPKLQKNVAETSYRIVTVVKAPFIIYDEDKNEWSGYCIDMINNISSILNFSYSLYLAPDGEFGTLQKNNTWTGMVKELKEKRADIGLGTLSVMAEREDVVDFTVPFYDLVGITVLMKRPKDATAIFKFLTVLEGDVWMCILGSYVFTSLLLWIFDRWSPYSYQNNREQYVGEEEKRDFTVRECLWFCMTSLTPQGGGEAPKNLSGRLVAATWWLFGFIIIASYTANLAAFLTVSRLDTPIESLDDLSKHYKIQYAPIINSEAHIYFQRMSGIEYKFYDLWKDISLDDKLTDLERSEFAVWDYPGSYRYIKMLQSMTESRFPRDLEEAVKRIRAEDPSRFAFIGDATDIRYLELTNCDIMMVGEEFSRKPYALAVQQGSPLKDQLNNAILQLLNQRKLEKFKNDWWSENPKRLKCSDWNSNSDSISIDNIGGVFIVIFIGIGMSCLTLAYEYWWYRLRPRHHLKNPDRPKKTESKTTKTVRFILKPLKKRAIPTKEQPKF